MRTDLPGDAPPITLAIASGKGGTGKTTVAVNLAATAPLPGVLVDADVEAPNLHLFLADLAWQSTNAFTIPLPEIDASKCDMCGMCVHSCRYHALLRLGQTPPPLLMAELCHSCGGCVRACPHAAIVEVPSRTGVVRSGSWRGWHVLQGELDIGQARGEPLINHLRKQLSQHGTQLGIVDAPPGATCPTVAATKGADYVILVTEPTPFGRHDLEMAMAMLRDLAVPHGIVINREGMGQEDIGAVAREANVPILGSFPHSRDAARIYAHGELLTERLPGFRDRYDDLWVAVRTEALTRSWNRLGEKPR